MADQIIILPSDTANLGKKLDTEELAVGTNTVQRERMQIGGASALQIASVLNVAPTTEYGVVVRNIPSGTQTVSGTVDPSDRDARHVGKVVISSANFLNDATVGTTAADAEVTSNSVLHSMSKIYGFNGTTWDRIRTAGTGILKVSPSSSSGGTFDAFSPPIDAMTNAVSAPVALSYIAGFNGTTWDRMRGDIANGLDVDVTRTIPNRVGSGSITALNGTVTLAVPGTGSAVVQIQGTWVATVTFQGTVDGTNWFGIIASPIAINVNPVSTTTVNGQWYLSTSGLNSIRTIATAFTSGTITVNIEASSGSTNLWNNVLLHSGGNPANTAEIEVDSDALSATGPRLRVWAPIFGFNGTTWDRARLSTSTPVGTEQALIVRNIPSGTQITDPSDRIAREIGRTSIRALSYAQGDAASNSQTQPVTDAAAGIFFPTYGFAFNGSTWDRTRTATGLSGTTSVTDIANVTNSPTGILPTLMLGHDATASAFGYRAIQVDSVGRIPVVYGAGTFVVSGTVTSNQGTAAALASGWPVKVTDGTNTLPTMDVAGRAGFQKIVDTAGINVAIVTAANALKVDGSAVTQPVSGTVTANIGTSGSLALDASVAGLSLTQGAATTGQKALLVEGAVTTAAPIYTTGNSNPVSLTTAGGLRTDIATIAGTAPTTVGKLDVKAADGDVFVRQATAANLNATVVQGTAANLLSQVSQPTAANLNATVIGTTADNAANPTTKISVLPVRANAASPSWTEGNVEPLAADLTGTLRVGAGIASTVNSSTVALGISGVFTGTFEEVRNFSGLALTVFSDVASATNGLAFKWSSDGTNVDRTESTSVLANTGRAFNISTRARYFRVDYTNGTTAQTTFRLQTTYLAHASGVITKPLSGTVTDDNFVQSVQAATMGRQSSGTFVNISSSVGTSLDNNITHFGNNAVVTGTGASGVGIPRVTISNDSTVLLGNTANTMLFAVIDTATSGDNTIVAADAANKIKLLSYVIVADAAVAVRWKSGAATNLSGAMSLAANGGAALTSQAGTWLLETAVNQALVLNLSAAAGARGHISYFKAP